MIKQDISWSIQKILICLIRSVVTVKTGLLRPSCSQKLHIDIFTVDFRAQSFSGRRGNVENLENGGNAVQADVKFTWLMIGQIGFL